MGKKRGRGRGRGALKGEGVREGEGEGQGENEGEEIDILHLTSPLQQKARTLLHRVHHRIPRCHQHSYVEDLALWIWERARTAVFEKKKKQNMHEGWKIEKKHKMNRIQRKNRKWGDKKRQQR
jgi:hypothetical protein